MERKYDCCGLWVGAVFMVFRMKGPVWGGCVGVVDCGERVTGMTRDEGPSVGSSFFFCER